ncbi:MAG: NAD(P)/FAD-dependent oxidoreductase [Gemmataceae bacterium]
MKQRLEQNGTSAPASEYDVIIVGAGAAGLGCGVTLRHFGIENFLILERHDVGASFDRWPAEMRFITPSFTSNQFGTLDLNAVALGTSPAFSLGREHPSGAEFAAYLRAYAAHFELPIQTGVDVLTVQPLGAGGFRLLTSAGEFQSRFVIWAIGEFQYPRLDPFPGAELCRHNAQVASWREVQGDDLLIIGGYESGADAAIHLTLLGKRVRVLDKKGRWDDNDSDPSVTLSPFTRERLQAARAKQRIELIGPAKVVRVQKTWRGYVVQGAEGEKWKTATPPILATGFRGGARRIAKLFEWKRGHVALTEQDEATVTPGLFLVGPQVRHDKVIFCFIYKFRQRFAIVARAIAERLGLDCDGIVETYRKAGMFLDDLSCCTEECVC